MSRSWTSPAIVATLFILCSSSSSFAQDSDRLADLQRRMASTDDAHGTRRTRRISSRRGRVFTGVTQSIKETTVTYDFRPNSDGFLIRAEWRRDFSDTPFFLTDTLGRLKTDQQTATIGIIWWWGTEARGLVTSGRNLNGALRTS